MSTTKLLNVNKDSYNTIQECEANKNKVVGLNPRYRYFRQRHFTAGDENQFQEFRSYKMSSFCNTDIDLSNNVYRKLNINLWVKNKNLTAESTLDTFRYMFNKFKKGIYVRILNNNLEVFLPFSKTNFLNEWSKQIKTRTSLIDFIQQIYKMENRKFNPKFVNNNIKQWYANNCLVRYEYPIREGDTNVCIIKNMLEQLCNSRQLPDIEFFINRRDFPLITKNGSEPYNNIWDGKDVALKSHNYEKYMPILSMCKSDRYADILMPTHEDWARVQSHNLVFFPRSCKNYNYRFTTKWSSKKPIAVFRGGSTGCGVTISTNMRLKIAYMSSLGRLDTDGNPYLDAGITNWNLRPRKIEGNPYLTTIMVKDMPFGLVDKLTPIEQSMYKYVINIDGHVSAFRLSLELSMGSVILKVGSEWNIWYSNMLKPNYHYIPIKSDLSDLIEKIKWCKSNDKKCKQIATNAKKFYNKYLSETAILDFLQNLIVDMKSQIGNYNYNVKSPLQIMLNYEKRQLRLVYPEINRKVENLTSIPRYSTSYSTHYSTRYSRTYGFLKAIEWMFMKILKESSLEKFTEKINDKFNNTSGTLVSIHQILDLPFVIKQTSSDTKRLENIHETYIGLNIVNNLLKYVPNFSYTFAYFFDETRYSIISEYIEGETLYEYMLSDRFDMKDFLFIFIQIALALQVAQNHSCFVHYDLTPWNIVLKRLDTKVCVDYKVECNKTIQIKTNLIPIILDYGKSNGMYKNIKHGFVNMFKTSSIQDILTLLYISIDEIINNQEITKQQLGVIFKLANFITKTNYKPKTFKKVSEIKKFFRINRKYSILVDTDKYDLENKNPYDFVKYVLSIDKNKYYNFDIKQVGTYNNLQNQHNPKQVFQYIFSNSFSLQKQSYTNFFTQIIKCQLPNNDNILIENYVIQTIQENFISVKQDFIEFLQVNKKPNDQDVIIETIENMIKTRYNTINNSLIKLHDIDIQHINQIIQHKPLKFDENNLLNINKILEIKRDNTLALKYNATYLFQIICFVQSSFLNSQYKKQLNNVFCNIDLFRLQNNLNKDTFDFIVKSLSKHNINYAKNHKEICSDFDEYLRLNKII